MTHGRSDSEPVAATPSADAGRSDRQLETSLNCELTTLQHQPSAESLWASAFGATPQDLRLGGGSGGGYALDPEQLDEVVRQWKDVLSRAESFDERIHRIAAVTSAAQDAASTGFTTQAQALGTNVQASHTTLKAYASAYIDRLQAVQRNYVGTEHGISASFRQDGGDQR